MNSNKKFDLYKSALYFLIANAVLYVAGVIIIAIFGLNLQNNMSFASVILPLALVSVLSLLFVLIYVGLRYDFAKAWTAVVASVHNLILSIALIALIRIPVGESLVAGFALVVALTTVFTLMITKNTSDVNLKNTDYSEVIKNAISKNYKPVVVVGAMFVAMLFVSLIVSSIDAFVFARLLFVMLIAVLYCTMTITLPIWCFFSSKMKNIKRVKTDNNVENQKVALAVQSENNTEENV